jgi:protein-S-isoprenylcysteine O-methyltransferase Ste14
MYTKQLTRFAVRECAGVVFMAVALFWSAGDIEWWPAWVLIAITGGWILATATVIVINHPELLAERLGPRKGAKQWDTILMSVHGLLQLALYVISGLDHRWNLTYSFAPAIQVAAALLCSSGYSLVVWSTASNAFFSQIVRIQTERGHTVSTGGPYRYLRHPAYAGGILTDVFMPILLASVWGLLIGLADSLVMILRTILEDRTLRAELPGYPEYSRHVRHRLVPGVW